MEIVNELSGRELNEADFHFGTPFSLSVLNLQADINAPKHRPKQDRHK